MIDNILEEYKQSIDSRVEKFKKLIDDVGIPEIIRISQESDITSFFNEKVPREDVYQVKYTLIKKIAESNFKDFCLIMSKMERVEREMGTKLMQMLMEKLSGTAR